MKDTDPTINIVKTIFKILSVLIKWLLLVTLGVCLFCLFWFLVLNFALPVIAVCAVVFVFNR